MLTVLCSWILISIIFLSIGDFLAEVFNRVTSRNESYSLIDTFVLGLFSLVIPLGLVSLWLPVNHWVLFGLLVFSILYWLFRYNRLKCLSHDLWSSFKSYSPLNRALFVVVILSLATYAIWSATIFDASYYHHQFVRWIEEYGTVPGLANLELRFGFNSNYLLLSAPFTLRFIFGEPVYLIQSLLSAYIVCWIISYTIKTNHSLKGFVLLVIYLLFFSFLVHALHDSSTDVIPALISFYLACRIILYPKELSNKYLLYVLVPIALVTFKLSIAPFAIISLYIFYVILKQKDYRALATLIFLASLVIIPWLIRNVIISGYLIFPLDTVNFFSFDWQVPDFVSGWERVAITNCARDVFVDLVTFGFFFRVGGVMHHKMWFINDLLIVILYLSAILSFPIAIYSYLKKKIEIEVYVVYIALLFSIVFWAISAPDFRFISGVMYAMFFCVLVLLFPSLAQRTFSRFGKYFICLFVLMLLLTSFKRTFNYYHKLKEHPGAYPRSVVWYKQYSAQAQESKPIPFDSVVYNGVKFYLSLDGMGKTYDKLPASVKVVKDSLTPKYMPLEALEMRGTTLKEGFRPIPGIEDGPWGRNRGKYENK